MIILPVPPSRPCMRMRARLALVPGLSDSYLSRIALTAGVMLIAREAPLLADSFRVGAPLSQPRPAHKRPGSAPAPLMVKPIFTNPVYHDAREVGGHRHDRAR